MKAYSLEDGRSEVRRDFLRNRTPDESDSVWREDGRSSSA